MAGTIKLFSVELTPEKYRYLSDLAYRENPQWPLPVDRYLQRVIEGDARRKEEGRREGRRC